MERTENVSPRRNAALVRFLLAFFTISLSVTADFAGASRAFQDRNQKPKSESVNLIPKIKSKKLKPGLNHFHTFSSGIKVWAKVETGEIMDWIFTDSRGQELPSAIFRDSKKDSTSTGLYCRKCVDTRRDDGKIYTICIEITCPKK